jgi:hypothetical protein
MRTQGRPTASRAPLPEALPGGGYRAPAIRSPSSSS